MRHLLSVCVLLFLLCSCMRPLSVQTEYVTHESLASYYVETPDPALHRPLRGQRMIISWYLPKKYRGRNDLELQLTVRLENRKEERVVVPLQGCYPQGYYIYELLNERYCETGGVLTYKVEIVGDGCVLESWYHPLWVELIKFNIPETSNEKI